MTMRPEVTQHGIVTLVKLRGEIDMANGLNLTDEVLAKMPDSSRGLVADLSDLRYLDSAGIRMLFEIAKHLGLRDLPLAIALPESSVLRSVLKMTHVETVAGVFATADEAIASIAHD